MKAYIESLPRSEQQRRRKTTRPLVKPLNLQNIAGGGAIEPQIATLLVNKARLNDYQKAKQKVDLEPEKFKGWLQVCQEALSEKTFS